MANPARIRFLWSVLLWAVTAPLLSGCSGERQALTPTGPAAPPSAPTPTPAAPVVEIVLSGTVTDLQDVPISGAVDTAWGLSRLSTTMTDDAGRFTLQADHVDRQRNGEFAQHVEAPVLLHGVELLVDDGLDQGPAFGRARIERLAAQQVHARRLDQRDRVQHGARIAPRHALQRPFRRHAPHYNPAMPFAQRAADAPSLERVFLSLTER